MVWARSAIVSAQTDTEAVAGESRLPGLLSGIGLQLANYALILMLALAVGAVVIVASGKSPFAAYLALFRGAFGSFKAIANTLDRSTVLILAGYVHPGDFFWRWILVALAIFVLAQLVKLSAGKKWPSIWIQLYHTFRKSREP